MILTFILGLGLVIFAFLSFKYGNENDIIKRKLADSENAKLLNWYIKENNKLETSLMQQESKLETRYKDLTIIIGKLNKNKSGYDIDKLIEELKKIR